MFPLISEQNTQTAKELPGKSYGTEGEYITISYVFMMTFKLTFKQLAAFMKSALYYQQLFTFIYQLSHECARIDIDTHTM